MSEDENFDGLREAATAADRYGQKPAEVDATFKAYEIMATPSNVLAVLRAYDEQRARIAELAAALREALTEWDAEYGGRGIEGNARREKVETLNAVLDGEP